MDRLGPHPGESIEAELVQGCPVAAGTDDEEWCAHVFLGAAEAAHIAAVFMIIALTAANIPALLVRMRDSCDLLLSVVATHCASVVTFECLCVAQCPF